MVWQKKTVEILDYILHETLKKGFVYIKELKPLESSYHGYLLNDYSDQYDYFINILIEYKLVEKRFDYISSFPVVTEDFIANGGFMSLYEKQEQNFLNEKAFRELSYKKLNWDAKVSKFQSKTRLWPLIISFLSLFIAIGSFFLKECNSGNSSKSYIHKKQNSAMPKHDSLSKTNIIYLKK